MADSLQTRVDSCLAAGGGLVKLEPGDYQLDAPLRVGDGKREVKLCIQGCPGHYTSSGAPFNPVNIVTAKDANGIEYLPGDDCWNQFVVDGASVLVNGTGMGIVGAAQGANYMALRDVGVYQKFGSAPSGTGIDLRDCVGVRLENVMCFGLKLGARLAGNHVIWRDGGLHSCTVGARLGEWRKDPSLAKACGVHLDGLIVEANQTGIEIEAADILSFDHCWFEQNPDMDVNIVPIPGNTAGRWLFGPLCFNRCTVVGGSAKAFLTNSDRLAGVYRTSFYNCTISGDETQYVTRRAADWPDGGGAFFGLQLIDTCIGKRKIAGVAGPIIGGSGIQILNGLAADGGIDIARQIDKTGYCNPAVRLLQGTTEYVG